MRLVHKVRVDDGAERPEGRTTFKQQQRLDNLSYAMGFGGKGRLRMELDAAKV